MIPASVRIYACSQPQDMRRSFDGLALAVRQVLGDDPRSGALFAFVNKRGNRLKVIWWDQSGYCILYKRAHGVRFAVPGAPDGGARGVRLDGPALRHLLRGVVVSRRKKKS